MARCGRKPRAEAAIEDLDGSPRAKQRLAMILKAMRSEITIAQACDQLGIGESRFHGLRNWWLQESLRLLEPQRMGRPPKSLAPPDPQHVAQLQRQVIELRQQQVVAEVRRQLAEAIPQSLPPEAAKKGGSNRGCQHPR